MSRSRKSITFASTSTVNSRKQAKRWASKAVRKYTDGISNGKQYKKLFPSCNIVDYKFYDFDDTDVNSKYKRK